MMTTQFRIEQFRIELINSFVSFCKHFMLVKNSSVLGEPQIVTIPTDKNSQVYLRYKYNHVQ